MGEQSIISALAWTTSVNVVSLFSSILRDEEKHDAVREVNDIIQDALKRYATQIEQERKRLAPHARAQDPKPIEPRSETPHVPTPEDALPKEETMSRLIGAFVDLAVREILASTVCINFVFRDLAPEKVGQLCSEITFRPAPPGRRRRPQRRRAKASQSGGADGQVPEKH